MSIDPFIVNALLAGIGVALVTGPLGCFVAWQRLAYFGDSIAHAALLGVVLALLTHMDLSVGIIAVAVAVTLGVVWLEREKRLASDTLLGMFAHGALALALVLIALSPSITIDVNGLLFGDILAVSRQDITLIFAMAIVTGLLLALSWRDLLRLTVHADIARVEGVKVDRLRLLLMLTIALSVAVSIKIIGILLIVSLLIIPAAAARYFAKTPTQMAILASLAGMLAVCGGLAASLQFDTPSGPSIILAALAAFAVARIFSVCALR
ncbi:MAG: metal ABC transporter permease [Pseudomonadota bacterium]|nr:metal ABC transporter permease [Pseudomonadota bacterium]MDE3038256.1 metal ABC transporter permease [Pseudomonadota bacterium]